MSDDLVAFRLQIENETAGTLVRLQEAHKRAYSRAKREHNDIETQFHTKRYHAINDELKARTRLGR